MPSIYEPDFDQERHAPEGFRALRALLGRQVGAERLGLSLWELAPGEAAYPYHFHLSDEELIVVLEGSPMLRTPQGWRSLAAGDVESFPTGELGAHQLVNWGPQTVRFLAFSPSGHVDVVVYPDSRKVSAAERRPDGWAMRTRLPEQDADYWLDEQPPQRPGR
jgi:uncharacterized cupin superfamily protein